MKTRLFKLGLLLVPSLCIGLSLDALAAGAPVSMLTQVQGDVQVSKDGKEWKKVDRNKFLFAGYQVKTGADGAGKLVNQATNLTQEVAANSVVEITEADVKALAGTISAPSQDSGNLVDGIGQRFDKAQRYTTVRRSVEKKASEIKLDTIQEITLSSSHPDLVWSGMGKEYSYRLVIDGKNYDIAASDNDIIRFTVPALSAGEHEYRVDVMQGNSAVYEPKKAGKIKWLSKDEEKQIADGLAKIEKTSPGDTFFKAYFLDDKGLTVSAMDLY
uniref:DUF7354 domain-containing protein n=1 Tax=Candidatus Magnetaquicoccus inordinatus TaxID=2496818 RepID=UPI00102CBD19